MDYFQPIINCFSTLCNCLQCSEDLNNQAYETNERTHLLADPVNSSPALRHTSTHTVSNEYSQSLPKKDDQNALCRILVQNTAINMIDVGAMDSHNLEHQEYSDRIKLYSQRLQQQWSNIQHPEKVQTGLLKDVSNPEYFLKKTAKMDDLLQIKYAVNKAQAALMDVKIDHKEAIVVPFRIP
ncbi:uncharacterized protein LOC119669826 [Teleopsis dalmanni]|uniref:uncharacterized protein LOC119669826 n=1 Tax=Teleopsis dalmanni TaxID=139649 RepID=UPI0018CEF43C|nr:uncharacterized protein LOC119669826 [Teleopsis dalmanni]